MSILDNRSLKKVTLKSTTTHGCFASNYFESNSYHNGPSIQNDTTSGNFIDTKYEAYEPSNDN